MHTIPPLLPVARLHGDAVLPTDRSSRVYVVERSERDGGQQAGEVQEYHGDDVLSNAPVSKNPCQIQGLQGL